MYWVKLEKLGETWGIGWNLREGWNLRD